MAIITLSAPVATGASSIWSVSPKPKFPKASLSAGSEGYVVVRAYISPEGNVTRAVIAKRSGDEALDEEARKTLLQWKMKPGAIKSEYATKGYEVRIDFRQEGPVIARYRDRTVYFERYESAKIWMWAPAPEYPFEARRGRIEGTAFLKVLIGPDGTPASVELVKTSGNINLDRAAVTAVRLWRAHKEYAGKQRIVPVRFTLHRPY